MIRSVRNRLLLGVILATTLIFLLASLALYSAIRRTLLTEFDDGLLARAKALASLAEQTGGKITIDLDAAQIPEFHRGNNPLYFLLWNQQGQLISSSDSVQANDFSTTFPKLDQPVRWSWKHLPNDIPGREVIIQFTPHPEGQPAPSTTQATSENFPTQTAQLLVAAPAQQLKNHLTWLILLLVAVFTSTILASAIVLYAVIQRGLKPLENLAIRISTLGHQSLSERLTLANASTELQPIIERLNELLSNVETAFTRERAFTADVAHELRTPLAGLTTALEVASNRRRTSEEYEKVIAKCSSVANSMRLMIENLLIIARADARQLSLAIVPLDLVSFIHQCWSHFQPVANAREIRVCWNLPDSLPASADAGLLAIVFTNIFDNATTYADLGGQITVVAHSAGEMIKLSIKNSGSQLNSADTAKVFDRFWRADTARTATGHHCGLGLSLCRRILSIMGGSISAETTHDGDFVIHLLLLQTSPP